MSESRSDLPHRLELLFSQVQTHALVLVDPSGVIVGWMAGAERLFGYTAEEIVGRQVHVLFTAEDLAKGLSLLELETARQTGEVEDDRWQVRRDGGRIWISGTLTAIRDEQGQLLGFAKIMRNRTDQKFQVETLDSRIRSLQQGEARKNTFISTLAHELRNPLAALAMATKLLQSRPRIEPSEIEFVTATVQRQIEFIKRLVDDLLETTRTAIGQVELRKEEIALQSVLEHAIETSRAAIEEKGLQLIQLLPTVELHIEGDPIRLRQVFVNLLQNAAKYTSAGGAIWIKLTAEGDDAVVRVQDTGIGIAADVMPHIFDLFTRGEAADKDTEGLGIGLFVVRDIVALHGGTVEVTSDGVGRGSEFTVRLPLARSENPQARQSP